MGWYETIKEITQVAERLGDAELKLVLAEVQVEFAKLVEDNAKLRHELTDIKGQSQTRQNMNFRNNAYWLAKADGENEGPFCPGCLDGENKKVRLQDNAGDDFWRCTVCKSSIAKPGKGHWGRTMNTRTEYDSFSD